MLDITKDIQSLTNFRRKSGAFLKEMKKSKRPMVLTVNGKAEAVVQDAESYQRLLDSAARADVYEAVRQGVEVIIDLATLTGACVIGLGPYIAGAMGNDSDLVKRIVNSGREVGESDRQRAVDRVERVRAHTCGSSAPRNVARAACR